MTEGQAGNRVDADAVLTGTIRPAAEALSRLPNIIEVKGTTLVIGDLHGDVGKATDAIRKFRRGDYDNILFLGDYVDRGTDSAATIDLLLGLKLQEGDRAHLIRGNHELLWVNSTFGFKDELERLGRGRLHRHYNEAFASMPFAALIDGTVLAVHGGIPEELPSLNDLGAVDRFLTEPDDVRDSLLLGTMWNDPSEECEGFCDNDYRGIWRVYGRAPFDNFMERNGLERLVRGHQRWPQGHMHFFDGRLVSVFSSTSYPGPVETKALVVDGDKMEVVPL